MYALLPQTILKLGLKFHCSSSATAERCGLSIVDYGLITRTLNLNFSESGKVADNHKIPLYFDITIHRCGTKSSIVFRSSC